MKYSIYGLILVLVLLVGCAATTNEAQVKAPVGQESAETTPQTQQITNKAETTPQESPEEIPADIKSVIEKGKIFLKSYSYEYKSPSVKEAHKIYVNGNKIKIIPSKMIILDKDNFYNTIYIDSEMKTAEAYCLGYSACGKNLGKVKDLDFKTTYIETPIGWLNKITSAEKIDERQVEGRASLYIQTNIGKVTLESHYGFIYMVEEGKNKFEFSDAAFNSVQDSDVVPS
ncbi:MAG: hypothetical protein KKC75_05255 [Nanoarchaeota archaeon]|nr:hypothetical protein [Nanoarchaeota archaeon]MBU1004217.1 hypothetical protein [Nanoarchaeota archaeon]MBU1945833.1 hypothetical protein [Nanoarchaeota archaeon]